MLLKQNYSNSKWTLCILFQLNRITRFMDNDVKVIKKNVYDLTEKMYHVGKSQLIHSGKVKIDQFYSSKMKKIHREKAT